MQWKVRFDVKTIRSIDSATLYHITKAQLNAESVRNNLPSANNTQMTNDIIANSEPGTSQTAVKGM